MNIQSQGIAQREGRQPDAEHDATAAHARLWPTISFLQARLFLVLITVLCLAPFVGKAFHIDDPLFVWVAKQIVQHPLDPYGFSLVWYAGEMPISQITKNPPLVSYYLALFGPWTHWSEMALHVAFLLPAIIAVLATFELAREFTREPLLAAALTLAAPAFLISATSLMSDVPMIALWLVSVLAWRKGLSSGRGVYLLLGAVLICLCILTKYFGACLVPLLFVYSLLKRRGLGSYVLYLLLPIGMMIGYQIWTRALYGESLLFSAARYALVEHPEKPPSPLVNLLVGLSFTGGCMLPALLMSPLLFRKIWLISGLALAVPGSIGLAGHQLGEFKDITNRPFVAAHLICFLAGGIFVFALAVADFLRRRDADSVFLSAWVLGTFVFAAFLNWTVNARSILPLLPAVAILIARRLDDAYLCRSLAFWKLAVPVLVSFVISFQLAAADVSWADSAREATHIARAKIGSDWEKVFFSGHWGFQYYMEAAGARPVDLTRKYNIQFTPILVQPANNTNTYTIFPKDMTDVDRFGIESNYWISPQRLDLGSGFYSSVYGPLPYVFGRVSSENYAIIHLNPHPRVPEDHALSR